MSNRDKMKQDHTVECQMLTRDFMSIAHKKDCIMLHYVKPNAQSAAGRETIEMEFCAIM